MRDLFGGDERLGVAEFVARLGEVDPRPAMARGPPTLPPTDAAAAGGSSMKVVGGDGVAGRRGATRSWRAPARAHGVAPRRPRVRSSGERRPIGPRRPSGERSARRTRQRRPSGEQPATAEPLPWATALVG